jgi:hypothetical protein
MKIDFETYDEKTLQILYNRLLLYISKKSSKIDWF